MQQAKKNNQWYFGMKIHVSADVNSGLVHTVSVTPTNAPGMSQVPRLLREEDCALFGDKGYVYNGLKRAPRRVGVCWGVALKASARHKLTGANLA